MKENQKRGPGWVILATIVFWAILLLAPFPLYFLDALSALFFRMSEFETMLLAVLYQGIAAFLAWLAATHLSEGKHARVVIVNSILAAVLSVWILRGNYVGWQTSYPELASNLVCIVVLVVCTVISLRERSLWKQKRIEEQIEQRVQERFAQSSAVSSPEFTEPPLINPAVLGSDAPPVPTLEEASTLLNNALEIAYKERYVEFRNALSRVVGSHPSGDSFMEQFKQLHSTYIIDVTTDALHALSHSIPQARSRFETMRRDPSSLVISHLDASVTGFGRIYALLYYSATQSLCSQEQALRHAQRFDMYAKAAVDHAAEEHGIRL